MVTTNTVTTRMSFREAIRILLLSPMYLQFNTKARHEMVQSFRRTCW